jgi:hypothetical protein
MKNLLTLENVIKAVYGIILLTGLYFGLDKRFSLLEQKFDQYTEKVNESKIEIKELRHDVTDISKQIVQLNAILPREIKIENK